MDFKYYNGKIILHLVDHSTRLSTFSFITYITYMFKNTDWHYGAPEKFLIDNGDEFANIKFIEMAE